MTAEARELMLWVARWGPAVRRPTTMARYDDLVPRFVAASIHPPAPERRARTSHPFVDLGDLPLHHESARDGAGLAARRSRRREPRAATTSDSSPTTPPRRPYGGGMTNATTPALPLRRRGGRA